MRIVKLTVMSKNLFEPTRYSKELIAEERYFFTEDACHDYIGRAYRTGSSSHRLEGWNYTKMIIYEVEVEG